MLRSGFDGRGGGSPKFATWVKSWKSFYFFSVAHRLDFDVSQGIRRRIKKLHFRVLEFEVTSNL
jgi:hypothetical protein